MENNTRKFKENYDIVTKSCVECGYENFPKFSRCKLCQRSINNDEQSTMIAYLDVERANGDQYSDLIQVGFIIWDMKLRRIIDKMELNILPSEEINPVSSKIHQIYRHGQVLYKGLFRRESKECSML